MVHKVKPCMKLMWAEMYFKIEENGELINYLDSVFILVRNTD